MLFMSAGQILRKGKRVPGAGMEYPCEFRGKGSLLPAGNRGGCGAGGLPDRPPRLSLLKAPLSFRDPGGDHTVPLFSGHKRGDGRTL